MSSDKIVAPRPLVVRCADRMVFQINRGTGEAATCSVYDAYCFTDPDPGVEYLEWADWVERRNAQRLEA